jgi:cysteine desulfurase
MTFADDIIYLDHAATTPVSPTVLDAMLPYFTERYGNPSSIYEVGQDGRAALDRARATVAGMLGCHPSEILFTSGATESDNLALSGIAWQRRLKQAPGDPPPHIITTAIEHHAVLHTADWLEKQGFSVSLVPVDSGGFVDPAEIEALIRPGTCLVSVMYANNEIGSIQPLAAISEITRRRGIPFHTDAVQAAGLLPLSVRELGVDLLSLSAHKFYGPKGVGMLYVRKGIDIAFQQHGGGQESGRRGGTENVAGIVGLAAALQESERNRTDYVEHCRTIRDALFDSLTETIPGIELNGPELSDRRLANNLNIAIPGIQGETMLLGLDMQGIAASAGSACTTGNSQPSHVLAAIGLSEERSRASLRFTVGRSNSLDQIEDVVSAVEELTARTRQLAGIG